jgi:hypothetical protein
VLKENPNHYGATYQLATALDDLSEGAEARRLWERFLVMAEAASDQAVLPSVRARLARPDETAALMAAGIDALYTRRDPATAIARFRTVLRWNGQHYGATYQLAVALDAIGNAREAQVWWTNILQAAEASGDVETADRAKRRLAQAP